MINLQDGDERAAAAGEYVLGTLSSEDRALFNRALSQDPALRAEVYAWQDRLLGLTARAAAISPRPQLWTRIDMTLDAMAPRPTARPEPAAPQPWWRQPLRLWQGASALATTAAVLMATLLLVNRMSVPEPAPPRYLAVLQSPDNQFADWVVEMQAGGRLRLAPVGAGGAVPAGRTLQFWTKPQGAAAPTSLGLVHPGKALEMPVTRLPSVGAQQLFEITLEPENGSPIGRPTGPILYVGRTVLLL